jgi:hypothetical protein
MRLARSDRCADHRSGHGADRWFGHGADRWFGHGHGHGARAGPPECGCPGATDERINQLNGDQSTCQSTCQRTRQRTTLDSAGPEE